MPVRSRPVRVLIACAALAACAQLAAGDARTTKKKEDPKAAEKGQTFQEKSPKHGRDFWCYVPSSCPKRNIALVFSYHGAGGTGQGEIGQWKKLAEEHGFIVACPTAELAGAGHKAGQPMPIRPEAFVEESEAAISIVEMLREKHKIDPRRVMVTGFSGGGNPSYWLGFVHSKVFPFLCTRCGNFPGLLPRAYAAQADVKAEVEAAAKSSWIYVYWGSRDHPIILGEIPNTIKWLDSLALTHFKQEKVEGMGHESRAQMAASWFMETMKEAGKPWEAEAKEQYPKALDAGRAAMEKKEYGEAVKQILLAAGWEEDYKLGRKAAEELKKIESIGRQQLDKAKSMASRKDPEAEKALTEVAEQFKGTDAGEKAAKALEEWKAKQAKK